MKFGWWWLFGVRYRMHVRASEQAGVEPMGFEDWKDLIVHCGYTPWRAFWNVVRGYVYRAMDGIGRGGE